MKSIGIDIGSYSVKVVVVEALSPVGFKISRIEEFPLTQDASQEASHKDKDKSIEIIEILRQFIPQHFNSEDAYFILALPKNQYIYRSLSFPFKQKYKILKALPFSLEDEIPFNKEEVIYESKIMDFKDNESHVMAFVAQKKSIKDLIDFSQNFHIDPNIVSLGEIALLNIYEKKFNPKKNSSLGSKVSPSSSVDFRDFNSILDFMNRKVLSKTKKKEIDHKDEENPTHETDEKDQPTGHDEIEKVESSQKDEDSREKKVRVLLHLGHKSSFVLFVQGSKILSFKHFDWGGESIALDLSKNYGISFRAALQELHNNGFILKSVKGASEKQIKTSELIKKNLSSFSRLLYFSLLQFKEKFHLEYEEITLSGGLALIRNIESEFEEATGINTFRASEKSFLEALDPALSSPFKVSFVVALGLALEGLKKSRNPPLNFLKEEFERKDQRLQVFMKKWSRAIQVSLALVVVFFIYSYQRKSLTSKMSEKSYQAMKEKASKIASIKGSKLTIENVKRFIKREERKSKSRKSKEQLTGLSSPLDILKEISESLPPREGFPLSIERFVVENDKVLFKGRTPDKKVMDELEKVFKRVSKSKDIVKTTDVKKDEKTPLFLFTMEFKVNRLRKGI